MVTILNNSAKPKEPIIEYKLVETESDLLDQVFDYLFELLEKENTM